MKTIYKFLLGRLSDLIVFEWPVGATVLHAATQHQHPCVWVMLDTDEKRTEPRRILLAGTGHNVPHEATSDNYVGTMMLHDGNLVLHVFDLDKAP